MTTEPLIPGESALDRRRRLQRDWNKAHMAERKAYLDMRRLDLVELRRRANPPPVKQREL